jgi:hypothetical protein
LVVHDVAASVSNFVPAADDVPAGHAVQPATAAPSFEYVPTAHSSHVVACAPEYLPASQLVHAASLRPDLALLSTDALAPAAAPFVPAAHALPVHSF